jgi:hypothetical protein
VKAYLASIILSVADRIGQQVFTRLNFLDKFALESIDLLVSSFAVRRPSIRDQPV